MESVNGFSSDSTMGSLVGLQLCLFLTLLLTYVERGVLPVDVVVDVGHPQRLHRRGPDAQQHLRSNQQQVHHVGVGPVAASEPRVSVLRPGVVGAHVSAVLGVPRVARLVLVLVRQELGQGREQRPQGHDDAAAANQPRPVGLGSEVADEEDEGQVADLKAAGDDAHICTLEVEASLQGGQNTYLSNK